MSEEHQDQIDLVKRVSGTLRYLDDLPCEDCLHGKMVSLPVPAAGIDSIHKEKALETAGVVAVYDLNDFDGRQIRFGPLAQDRPVLADGTTKYEGEPVAVVLAVTEDSARLGASRLAVDFHEIGCVTTIDRAMATDAPLVHNPATRDDDPFKNTNIMGEWKFGWGDCQASKNACKVIITTTYQTPFIHHFALEPYSVVADYNGSLLEIHAAIQHPFFLRKILSRMLNLSSKNIRIKAMEMGGGFGGRGYPKLEPLAAILAIKQRRKIKLKLDGDESFLQGQREASQINIETGFDARGKILYQHLEANFLVGAYADISPRVVQKAGFLGSGPYVVPNLSVLARGVFSNNTPTTAFRGFGATHISFAIESQINQAAQHLGIDQVAIREMNLPNKGDTLIPRDHPVDGEWKAALKKAASLIAWNPNSKKNCKMGIAIGIKSSVPATVSQAKVKLMRNGKINAYVGTTEMGQGSKMVLGRIVAAQFAIRPDKVKVIAGDTARVPVDTITASSRSTVMMGSALVLACDDIKRKIELHANDRFEHLKAIDAAEPHSANDSAPNHYEVYLNGVENFPAEIIGNGTYTGDKDPQHPLGGPAAFWEYIVTAVEIDIDEELGTLRLKKLVNVSDAGRVINPKRAIGQDEGGAVMAIGAALMEQLVFSESGRLLNGNALDYKIPTSRDIPDKMVTIFQENGDGPGPYGCKGIGESGILACLPAIAGAIYNATGILINRIPVSPEFLWRLLKDKNRNQSRAGAHNQPEKGE